MDDEFTIRLDELRLIYMALRKEINQESLDTLASYCLHRSIQLTSMKLMQDELRYVHDNN